jgi:hypothetical protein
MAIWSICGYLVHFVAIWYILWLFGIYIFVLVGFPKKNLATLGLYFFVAKSVHRKSSAQMQQRNLDTVSS